MNRHLILGIVVALGGAACGEGTIGLTGFESDDSEPAGTLSGPVADDAALLMWSAPTTNEDGSPLVDLAGYIVHYGSASGVYSAAEDIGIPTCQAVADLTDCTYTVRGLTSGTWYFAVGAYNTSGLEGGLSNEASKTLP